MESGIYFREVNFSKDEKSVKSALIKTVLKKGSKSFLFHTNGGDFEKYIKLFLKSYLSFDFDITKKDEGFSVSYLLSDNTKVVFDVLVKESSIEV